MNFNVPYRQIFLDDVIAKETTGRSPLKENKKLADIYFLIKRLNNASILSSLAFAYLALNKRYTKRWTYAAGFGISLGFLILSGASYASVRSNCIKEFKCKEEHLAEYAWFYHYAQLDYDDYYEQERRKH